jgi:protein TonB
MRTAVAVARPERDRDAAGSGPAEIPDSTYYGARQLDVYPALASALDLPRPSELVSEASQGYVLLLVLIDATGVVDDVSIVEAQAPGITTERALAAMRAARFSPAVRSGRPVKSRVFVRLDYGTTAELR